MSGDAQAGAGHSKDNPQPSAKRSSDGGATWSVGAAVNSWSAEFLDGEYARFKADPNSVPEDSRRFFQGFDLALASGGTAPATGEASPFQSSVNKLINAYRESGHLCAKVDPFGRERDRPEMLSISYWGLTEADLDRRASVTVVNKPESRTLREIVDHLEKTYCGSIALEFMHIRNQEERDWFLDQYERHGGMMPLSANDRTHVLEQLARAETFEAFCQKRYAGEKRFSLEGGISLIPMLDRVIERASDLGVDEMVLGMPHRGRLNVLNNTLGKSWEQIFTEFEDNWEEGFADGGGDVKYHRGYSGTRSLRNGREMRLAMASNPSHLESVNAVVLGRCRAKQRVRGDHERRRVVPLLIHGDAAVAGQGAVAECLNFSRLEGYTAGGCVHIVVNNMIGFTTVPEDARSTTYCTDVAKMIDAPIFHVSGEDPEACVAVARLAIDYRQRFRKDVFIDLYCYRKYGHNEQDEQAFTQPLLAAIIKERPTTLTLYKERLLAEGVIDQEKSASIDAKINAALDSAQEAAKKKAKDPTIDPGSFRWVGMNSEYSHEPVETGIPLETLREICTAMGSVPEGFTVHPRLEKLLADRKSLIETGRVSHADAELIAIGSLLLEGTPVRLSGQDSRRGTFTQRHAVIRDFVNARPHVSLNAMRELGEYGVGKEPGTTGSDGRARQAQFCVWDSPLSEVSVMGFDYGYSLADPNMLVMWEAQFGDFANGAQVIIDQYIASAEIKWERWSGFTLLLPHGYEGAGPEHSSARMERFLELCANDNIQVVYPSTGAQMFHLLRRQVRRAFRKPLVVMTPKSMLREPTSTIEEFTKGSFRDVIDDATFGAADSRRGVKRLVFCSGKIYHELVARREATGRKDIAFVRVEQLYPLHAKAIESILALYPNTAERVWVQEEPRNAGAYLHIADRFRTLFGVELKYIGREASSTPAVGSKRAHKYQQEDILRSAVGAAPGGKADAKAPANGQAPAKPAAQPVKQR
ncbi:MAG: 2-oxoglutarate dehydrogenase E1 component [Phycisphaerales bacterium]|nr:MAG: 2-oxoglutarate dehydrogenase E1 component [Phycisphaerales bacterium]